MKLNKLVFSLFVNFLQKKKSQNLEQKYLQLDRRQGFTEHNWAGVKGRGTVDASYLPVKMAERTRTTGAIFQ